MCVQDDDVLCAGFVMRCGVRGERCEAKAEESHREKGFG